MDRWPQADLIDGSMPSLFAGADFWLGLGLGLLEPIGFQGYSHFKFGDIARRIKSRKKLCCCCGT